MVGLSVTVTHTNHANLGLAPHPIASDSVPLPLPSFDSLIKSESIVAGGQFHPNQHLFRVTATRV